MKFVTFSNVNIGVLLTSEGISPFWLMVQTHSGRLAAAASLSLSYLDWCFSKPDWQFDIRSHPAS